MYDTYVRLRELVCAYSTSTGTGVELRGRDGPHRSRAAILKPDIFGRLLTSLHGSYE